MALISIIAAVDEENGLGRKGQLLCHLPADLRHFKNITMGKPIIMGRTTFESIGKPLQGRKNVVLTSRDLPIEGIIVADSFTQALLLTSNDPEVMIIGGAIVFDQALPLASRIYLTRIHHQFSADVFFPQLILSEWLCAERIFRPRDEKNNYDMTFYRYERKILSHA